MSVTVTCWHCQRPIAVRGHMVGMTVACPHCQAAFTVPQPSGPGPIPNPGSNIHYPVPAGSPAFPSPSATRPASVNSSTSTKRVVIILSAVLGGILLLAVCGGVLAVIAFRSQSRTPQSEYANLREGRGGFRTTLTRREKDGFPTPDPPAALFTLEKYRSPLGEMDAYVSRSPGNGKKHPAIIWVFGGFSNSIGETAWEPASPDNDQSASAFRRAGLVMMYPSFRGGNQNPGYIEAFYGEVDDLLAAADHLAKKDYVDPQRIYLGGHSTGGTMVLLAAAADDRFRAVFAFGPVDDVSGYGPEVLPFNLRNDKELTLRNPIQWLHAMKSPVFVFEGTGGNIRCLRSMQRASKNPQLHFHEVPGADHFEILAPLTTLVANRIRQDTGPTCNIKFSEPEIRSRF